MRKSFGLELHGEWSESADECFGPVSTNRMKDTCPESRLMRWFARLIDLSGQVDRSGSF